MSSIRSRARVNRIFAAASTATMPRAPARGLAIGALCLLAGIPAWSQDFASVEFRTTPLRGDLYLLQGYGGNVIVSVGADGTLIVDDEYEALSGKLEVAIEELEAGPAELVVNTHWHHDHTGGNVAFGSSGALIVAHERSRSRMTADQIMSLYGPQEAYDEIGWPRLTFPEALRLHYNGDTIDLRHIGPAHTDGDAVVVFREDNVVHTGDLFVGFRYRPPYFDKRNGGTSAGMIEAARSLLEIVDEETIIVPGHGEPATRAELREYETRLSTVCTRIREGVAAGLTVDEVVATRPADGFGPPGGAIDQWVRFVYAEYSQDAL